jgi:hypothetical protein
MTGRVVPVTGPSSPVRQAFGERREIGAKHLDRSQTAVQQNEGSARAANLVVKLDPVHLGVAAAPLARFCTPRVDLCLRVGGG